MSGISELAAATVQAAPAGGVSRRTGTVTAVNAGPPRSLDVQIGGTVVPKVRYSATYFTLGPAPGDVVIVEITRSGGSGRRGGRTRGGSAFVVDKVAV